MNKKKFDTTELYTLCNKQQLFTCGTNEQYSKMFELAGSGVTRDELAYILYLCSDYRLNMVYYLNCKSSARSCSLALESLLLTVPTVIFNFFEISS